MSQTQDNITLLTASSLARHYRFGSSLVKALDGVDLDVRRGEFLGIVGASGSGKSTLLNLLGGLDTPTAGAIRTAEGDLNRMNPRRLARYRATEVGMIFQSFNLVPHRSALGNVELALYFLDVPLRRRRALAAEMLTRVGLADRLEHRPADLSGGEQQRVAIARALVKNPALLLADEPTGNLDRDATHMIGDILADWNRGGGTVIMVTHNLDLARARAHRVLRMDYGRFVAEDLSAGGLE
ncbi:MAG: ABC transporter ATP-binding protein [Candidatus Zixiibacteriota bacterium]|nr:MAG: ABC transporter ATP-binding protein [candidate division Zixibacteria bacterium]